MSAFSIIVALVAIVVVFLPFVLGRGGQLASAASQQSQEALRIAKDTIVSRFVRDEMAFRNKQMSQAAWRARREYLVHRYLDAARRLDYLSFEAPKSSSKTEDA